MKVHEAAGKSKTTRTLSLWSIKNMFVSHPSSALEYWFFKVNVGPIALIVDWIERHKTKEHLLRASIHSPYKREVIFKN